MIHSTKLHWTTRLILIFFFVLLVLMVLLFITRDGGLPWISKFVNEVMLGPPTPTPAIEIVPTSTAPLFSPGTALVTAIGMSSIYSSPAEDSDVIALLEPGKKAKIIGMNAEETWWAIEVPYLASGTGWVLGERVLAENTLEVRVLSENEINSGVSEKTGIAQAIVNVNIRTGPGMNFQKIGTLEIDQEAVIVGVDADRYWFLIKVPDNIDEQGWISVDYVITRNADDLPVVTYQPENANQDVPAPGVDDPAITALSVVNIRSGPDLSYEILGKLQVGQRASVVGISEDGKWFAIEYTPADSGRAWVAADYVEAKNVEELPILL